MSIKLITTGDPKIDEAFRSLTTFLSMQQDKISSMESSINALKSLVNKKAASSNNITVTSDGGVAIILKNNTGAESVKGYVVTADETELGAVKLIEQGGLNPIGVIYESGVPDGLDMLVSVSGIADVYFSGSTSVGNLARGPISSDATHVDGQAISESYPSGKINLWQGNIQLTINPVTINNMIDGYFYKLGIVIESRTGAGLAKTVLHFN